MPSIGVARRASEIFGSMLERGVYELQRVRVRGDDRSEQQIRIMIETPGLDGGPTVRDLEFIDIGNN